MQDSAAHIPVAFQLAVTPPNVDFLGGDLLILSGAAAGKTVPLRQIVGDVVVVGVADAKVSDSMATSGSGSSTTRCTPTPPNRKTPLIQ